MGSSMAQSKSCTGGEIMAPLYDWKGKLLAKMKAEGCADLSPEEINRVFKGCVAGSQGSRTGSSRRDTGSKRSNAYEDQGSEVTNTNLVSPVD
jgi:hypothetical protein